MVQRSSGATLLDDFIYFNLGLSSLFHVDLCHRQYARATKNHA